MTRALKFKDGGYGWGRKHELEEPVLEPSVAVRDHVGTVLEGGRIRTFFVGQFYYS